MTAQLAPQGYLVPGSDYMLTVNGSDWQLTASGQIYRDGRAQPSGNSTLGLAQVGSTLWGLSASNGVWYKWNPGRGIWDPINSTPPGIVTSYFGLDPDLELIVTSPTVSSEVVALAISVQVLRHSVWGGPSAP